MMGSLAEEAGFRDVLPVQSEALELDIAGTVREVGTVHVEHIVVGRALTGSPDYVNSAGAVGGKDDPCIRITAVSRFKCAGERIVARLYADDIPGNCHLRGREEGKRGGRRCTRTTARPVRCDVECAGVCLSCARA